MMDTPPIQEETRRRSGPWLEASLLFVLLQALPSFSYPLGRDQSTYSVIAQGLLNGQRLYRDLWDNKPPGIFAVYSPIVKALGHVMWSVGLIDILWMLAISWCIFKFSERYLGAGAAVIAVVVNAAWHTKNGYVDAAQPECFLMLAVFLAFFTASSRRPWPVTRHFGAGLLLGVAFWLKYNALAFLPLLAVVPYVDWAQVDSRPRKLRFLISTLEWFARFTALLVGLICTILTVAAYFRWTGSWAAFKEVQFQVLPRYAAMAAERIPHVWLLPLGATLVYLGIWTVLATVVAILLAEKRGLAGLLPVLVATAMGFIVTASQLRFPPYAFETSFPFFAMVWGYVSVRLYSMLKSAARSESRTTQMCARFTTVAFAVVILWFPIRMEVKSLSQRYRDLSAWRRNPGESYAHYQGVSFNVEHLADKFQLIEELQRSLRPEDQVFVWGTDPLIYYLTNRQPPTRFVSNLPLMSPWGPLVWKDELTSDLIRSRPRFIVVSLNDQVPDITFTQMDSAQDLKDYKGLNDLISSSYERVRVFPDYVLLRHKPGPITP